MATDVNLNEKFPEYLTYEYIETMNFLNASAIRFVRLNYGKILYTVDPAVESI